MSAMGWISGDLKSWLSPTRTTTGAYNHSRIDESAAGRQAGLEALRDLVVEAHADAVARLDALAAIDLHPLGRSDATDAILYPDSLDTRTLQGYLGEILAGLVAENFEPHDRKWQVPAFLFRTHVAAFQALERRRQLGGPAKPIPGRGGDDCLAFIRDDEGRIIEWLMCEAKCTHGHSATLIAEGHQQLSHEIRVPVDLLQLIEILTASDDPSAPEWVDALRLLLQAPTTNPGVDRLDLFMYVCGRSPVSKPSWIPKDKPHDDYLADGPLEAVELHLKDFDAVIEVAYPEHEIVR